MATRRQVGELEAEVLSVLAGSDRALTPGEVQAELRGDLAYSTVSTILTRLCSKELAARGQWPQLLVSPRGGRIRPHRRSDAFAAALRPDPAGALGHFVSGLSPEEAAALRRVLDQADETP